MGASQRGLGTQDDVTERTQTLRTLVAAGAAVLAAATAIALLMGKDFWTSVFPYASMLVAHGLVYAIARKGWLRVAVTVHVVLYLAIVAFVMSRYGGVRSPAGFVLPPIVLLAGFAWNARAALVTAAAAALLTLVLLVFEQRGFLGPATQPDPIRMGVVIIGTLVITAAILAVALRLLAKAKTHALEQQSARLRLEERLAQGRTLDTVASLAAGLAHDFNNVLTVILALASSIERGADPKTAKEAREIEHAVRQAATLTRLLLAFGRNQPIEPRLLDVNASIREAEPLLRRFAGESQLDLELGTDLAIVRADPTQLQQVLLNLVGNARDAMPETGGAITIRTKAATREQLARFPRFAETGGSAAGGTASVSEAVALEVIDNGRGMSAEVKARLFEPFFTTKDTGTGIGLAAVKEIVEQSGGAISVESREGGGSRFTVLLGREG